MKEVSIEAHISLFKKYLLHIIKFKNICVVKTIFLFTSNKISSYYRYDNKGQKTAEKIVGDKKRKTE